MAAMFHGHSDKSTTTAEQTCAFGTIVRALWPDDTAARLAQRAGCSKRAALYLIQGQRKVTARALAAVIAEIVP